MSHTSKSTTPMSLTDDSYVPKTASAGDAAIDHQSDTYSETYFDALYSDSTDPWEYQTRWYEKRKRDMCLAVLPQAQYSNAIELGCGNGVFSELLARRCQALVSIDGNKNAVELSTQRLAGFSHVRVIQGVIPNGLLTLGEALLSTYPLSDLPANPSPFDLIVISEILYYLSPTDIDTVIAWIEQNLAIGGTLLCCHWRYPIDGFKMTGEMVHQRLHQTFNLTNTVPSNKTVNIKNHQGTFTHQSKMVDTDFLLDVWQNSPKSVAMQENLI
ncbi:class I SAM-dependent DNA methyltransferase [Psychrobacter aquaticus]|uniref:Methyltransferase type 12 n=1 Tax=Psychrobacter aquaticus CMS 56 TaxID=1354303 RepID=U4TAX9_9GAMM|nr:class I SAM-dependent methyltransferase [Psychrobacter aquaticus]ERL55899.1 Methyltransferase type 12 [Psychrobacter aquaticus CMS 56]